MDTPTKQFASDSSWLMKLLDRGKTEKFMETIDVTREIAHRFLDIADPNNRNLSKISVDNYAHDMLAGYWVDNGEAIQVLTIGMLGNGHNRLNAVLKAAVSEPDISVRMTFIFGIAPEARRSFDQGKNRSAADRFKIEMKVAHGAAMASAIGLIEAKAKGGRTVGGRVSSTISDILKAYEKNRSIYDDAADRIIGIEQASRLGEGALLAGYLVLTNEPGIDVQKVNVFFDKLIRSEELPSEVHITALRRKLIQESKEKRTRGWRPWERLELIMRYWLYYINEKPLPANRGLAVTGSYPNIQVGKPLEEENGEHQT
jgi:hypothetical protein